MYIIELFIKIKNDLKNRKYKKKNKKEVVVKKQEVEKCNHTFVPIDSTKKILACSKCGMIYKIKNKNPFE